MDNCKVIEKDGHRFFVKPNNTINYYKNQDLCHCIGCRNYYRQIKSLLPILDEFLSEFGVDIEKPDEIEWFNYNGDIHYNSAGYTVCGMLPENDDFDITIEDKQSVSVKINKDFCFPNSQKESFFNIIILNINLPNILDEPICDDKPSNNLLHKIKRILKK